MRTKIPDVHMCSSHHTVPPCQRTGIIHLKRLPAPFPHEFAQNLQSPLHERSICEDFDDMAVVYFKVPTQTTGTYLQRSSP
jgi:hypothetical protein